KRAAEVNAGVAKGIDPRQAKREMRAELTFGEFFAEYLEKHAKAHKRTWDEDQRIFHRDLKAWHNRRLSEITHADVLALHVRKGHDGKYQANRTLALVHVVFEKALQWGALKGDNPAAHVKKYPEQSRERFLHDDEMERFFAAVRAEREPFADFFS